MIIGITGQACSGKDTLATAIQKELQGEAYTPDGAAFQYEGRPAPTYERGVVPILHFADALRDVTEAVFGSRYETQEEKAAIDPFWQERIRMRHPDGSVDAYQGDGLGSADLSGRRILQYVGTEMFRLKAHRDIWLFAMERRIAQRPAQHHIISDVRFDNEAGFVRKQGGIVIMIMREGQALPAPDAHASERGVHVDLIHHHYISGSVEQTQACGLVAARQIMRGELRP